MVEFLALAAAGFLAGALNAVAGGGTFITFPALVWLGLPPIAANATATVAALPGYVGSALAFRSDIRPEGALGLRATALCAALGAGIGSLLLLITPSSLFEAAVPWLLVVATGLFAVGPRLLAALRARGRGVAGVGVSAAAIVAVSIYGGYFNGGLGIMLLATFGLLGYVDLHGMNGLKNTLSALLSLVSAIAFALAGIVAWQPGVVLALACAAGGWAGARAARRATRTDRLRVGIVLIGLGVSAAFLLR
ncbi:sulfite exporter TauE/SafE family protein [Albimonas sp. CAU 1670]|uniref:sulfite exporter TauE/SafE family protein n=1 Tax=Albimonas sp. CAU 1670 TaxID=3032599 RepID=UPI0023DB4B85|nr:sulfite exporter TauE/SafE family protein [Albimonas sp. CAU 1670]MDF2233188.1 sulfite exporter TauE/SafE family protein [Albimonas sp. CAU 1670]